MNSGSKLSGCQALLSVGSLLPPCLACLPSLCLPASLFSLSPSPSSSLPLPASVYLIDVGLGAAVLCGGTFLVSSLILLPLEQKENWLPTVQHLPLKPGEWRGGKRVLCIPGCLCRQWACSVTSLEMPLNCCQIHCQPCKWSSTPCHD